MHGHVLKNGVERLFDEFVGNIVNVSNAELQSKVSVEDCNMVAGAATVFWAVRAVMVVIP